jgi:hypothetical protein
MSGYLPLEIYDYQIEKGENGLTAKRVVVAPSVVQYSIAEDDSTLGPDAGYSLIDAIVESGGEGVADLDGNIIYGPEECERLYDLALTLKHIRYNFPQELQLRKQWVLWKEVPDENYPGHFRKQPFSPLTGKELYGKHGSAERESHYLTFDDVETAAFKHQLGVGFEVTAADPYVAVDFDHAIKDGVLHPSVAALLKNWLPSYTERSVSGTGLHTIGYATASKNLDPKPVDGDELVTVEIFTHKFVVCTGDMFSERYRLPNGNGKLGSIQTGVEQLFKRFGGQKTDTPEKRAPMTKQTAQRIYADNLIMLKDAPEGDGNNMLFRVAAFAGNASAAGALAESEAEIKRELFRIVTGEWRHPHPRHSARTTIESGWNTGIEEPLEIKEETELEKFFAKYNETFYIIKNYGNKTRVVWFEKDDHPDFIGRWQLASQSFEEFAKAYLNDKVYVSENGKLKKIYATKAWLEDDGARRLDRVIFQPEQKKPNCLNLWRGWAVDAVKGDPRLYLDHLSDVICDGNTEYYDWLIKWMAFAVQHPNERGHAAVVFRGDKGIGKNLAADGFGNPWGQHYLMINNLEHFLGRFNYHLKYCSVLNINEAIYAGSHQFDASLKALVTDPKLPIEQKFVDLKMCPNLTHIMILSNADWVVPATRDERRYFVLDVSEKRKGDKSYFQKLSAFTEQANPAILHYLLHEVDLGDFNPRYVPTTKALYNQMTEGLTGAEASWFECLWSGRIPGVVQVDGTAEIYGPHYIKWANNQRRRKWEGITEEKLGFLFGGNPRTKTKGMGFTKKRRDNGGRRVWAVQGLKEARKAWTENRFPTDWPEPDGDWEALDLEF